MAGHEPNAASAPDAERTVAVELDLIFPIRPLRQLRYGQALHRLDEVRSLLGERFLDRFGHRKQCSSGSGLERGAQIMEVHDSERCSAATFRGHAYLLRALASDDVPQATL